MNADDEKKLREAFEKWVSSSPFECSTERMTEKSAWPGRYRFSSVSLAWEAWQDAHTAGHRSGMTEAMQKGYEIGFNASCEGWNGEYPYYQEDPTKDADWIARRDDEIAAAIEKARDAK